MLYKNQEIDISKCNFNDGYATIPLGDITMGIPEDGATEEEIILIEAIKEEVTKRPILSPDPIIIYEPLDEEKAAFAEAAIFLSGELETIKKELQTLKGGN